MFLGKSFLEENNIHPFGESEVQSSVQEIHIEIVGQNAACETSPTQVHNITSLSDYFSNALKGESLPVEHSKCFCCGEKYLCFKALYNHSHSKHEDSASGPLRCFICEKLFVFTKEYNSHLISDHNITNPDTICYVCLMSFANCEAVISHRSSHQANYPCGLCSTKLFSQDQLDLHQQYHNCSKKLMCDVCGITFQCKLLLGLHLLRHKQIECPLMSTDDCSSFSSEVELINHYKESHQHDETLVKISESYDNEETSLDELLQTSRIIYNGQPDFESWLSKITLKQDVECITCSIKLTSVFQLWLHFLKNHANSGKCLICGKRFKESIDMLLHLGSENCDTNVMTLKCPQCEDKFHQQEDVLDHQLTHVKPLQCSVCDSSFQKKLEMKRHLQDHGLPPKLPEPIYTCPVCLSRWPCMPNLRRHIRTHANERPFQCEQCGATFKRQQALKVHSTNSHSAQTHECPHCHQKCRTKQALFFHVSRVHVRCRRFVCGLCAKPWPQNQNLRRHLSNTHNLDYPPLTKPVFLSSKAIHVIPPIENLASHDPLRIKIEEVIAEEKEKLRSLYVDFGAGTSSSEDTIAEDSVYEKSDLPPTETEATAQASDKIYLICDSCDFRCEDINVWIEHTSRHKQISLNSQAPIPLEIVNVPIVPVEPIFVSPVIPTPTINYGTLVTVLPTSNNLTTINEPFASINPTLMQQPVVAQPLDTLVLTDQETLTGGVETVESVGNSCEDSGELININGMYVRIERYEGDATDLISKSTISFENAAYEKTNEINAGSEPVLKIAEGGDENESVSSDESNLTDEINENIEDIVKLANEGGNVEIDPSELIRLAESSDVQSSPQKATVWSCKQCGKGISSFKSLQRHMHLHTGEKPFICVVCDKAFSLRYNLKTHMLSHTQETPYSCSVCGKKVRYFKEFVDHQKKHQGIKDYSCSICGRSFLRQRELARHQNIHFSEKKYQCPVCSKYFMRSDYLKFHIPQMHGKFPCTRCKKYFVTQHQLDQHLRTHSKSPSSRERFTCPICEKTFARNCGLKTHLQLHTSKAHVVCYACPRKFGTMDAMLTHLGNFHKKWRNEIAEENRSIVENCTISVQTQDATGEVYTQNIEGTFKVNTLKASVISPQ